MNEKKSLFIDLNTVTLMLSLSCWLHLLLYDEILSSSTSWRALCKNFCFNAERIQLLLIHFFVSRIFLGGKGMALRNIWVTVVGNFWGNLNKNGCSLIEGSTVKFYKDNFKGNFLLDYFKLNFFIDLFYKLKLFFY